MRGAIAALSAAVLATACAADTAAPRCEAFPDGARVAFFGDSITRNGGAVLRTAAHYREAFPERDVRFFNCGISGGGLAAAEMYFDSVLAVRRPTHVVLAFGVNDAFEMYGGSLPDASAEEARLRRALAAFRDRYAAMCRRIVSLGAKLIVRVPTPYNESGSGTALPDKGKAEYCRRVADEIRAVAETDGIPFVDDFERMSKCLVEGEDVFSGDRIHPNDFGQWRMAETLLAAQGEKIAPYAPRAEVAKSAGLEEWDALSQRIANVNSAEWLLVRDESLGLEAKLAKVRDWLAPRENDPKANGFVLGLARGYLVDKPREAALREAEESAWPMPIRLTFGTAPTGDGGRGFGILAEYDDGGPGRVRITRRTAYDNPAATAPDYFRKWGTLCGLRVYDPDGNLAAYLEMGDQTEREKTYVVEVPKGKSGVWRVSVSGGFAPAGRSKGDEFDVEMPQSPAWGVRGEKRVMVIGGWPEDLATKSTKNTKGWMVFSPASDLFYLTGRGVEWFIDGKAIAGEEGKSEYGPAILARRPREVQTVELKFDRSKPWSLFADGLPGLVSPTPEMACRLNGGLVQAKNGLWLEGPLQARAMNLALAFKPEDLAWTPPCAEEMDASLRGSLGTATNLVVDPSLPCYGLSINPRRSSFRTLPHDMMRYCGIGYSPRQIASFIEPGKPATVNRAALNMLAAIAHSDAAGRLRATGDRRPLTGGRIDCSTMFEPMHGVGVGYGLLHRHIAGELAAVVREGVMQIVDKELGFLCYESNQWMHILEALANIYCATGEPRYRRTLEIQLKAFLGNDFRGKHGQTEAGYFSEEYGPDGNYDQMSLAPLARIYLALRGRGDIDRELLDMIKSGIEKNLRFRSLFAIPDPATTNGAPYQLAYAMNHRTEGPTHFDSHHGLSILAEGAPDDFPLAKALKDFGGRGFKEKEPLCVSLFTNDNCHNCSQITNTNNPVNPVNPVKENYIDLPGFAAVRRGPWYGVQFWKVYDNSADGFLGPLFLWHEKAGLGLCGIRHSYGFGKFPHWFGSAMDANDITFATVYGELDGKLYIPSRKMRKTFAWDVPGKKYTVTGTHYEARKGRDSSRQSLMRGTISWTTEFSDSGAVNMEVKVDFPDLKNATVNLPFLDMNGRTVWSRGGKRPWKIDGNRFVQTATSGVFTLTFQDGMKPEVAENLNGGRGWVVALRLPVPESGRVGMRLEAE